ncbi:MAG TPA: trehalose-phosphatase [Steroidobacteraceae bacterium]|nr:trehalose-phosphatase [Steroidobacteraceae bacterium]
MTANHPPAPSKDWCLFLDVDGTLLEFSGVPSPTHPDAALNRLLDGVSRGLDDRLALISGRTIDNLDALFAPRHFAAAGLHGLERRGANGERHRLEIDARELDPARTALRAFLARHPGTLLEDKGAALALHYRGAIGAEEAARTVLAGITAELGEHFHVQEGNMVMEIKPSRYTKATAIAAFLDEAPFAGRTPVFVGDDFTDLDGFRVVDALGGVSIAVGDRVQARWRIDDPPAVRAWLAGIAALGELR